MNIFNDYESWKKENQEFIYQLVKSKSKTISRFTSVIAVVDYLYEKHLHTPNLSEEEEIFFSTGFDYIYDNFYTIKTILDYKFNNDFVEMEKHAKTINLLLYVHEFQSELLNQELRSDDLNRLDDFEEKVSAHLDRKENIPDAYFPMLDDIVTPIFQKLQIEFQPIESIFYEVALEFGIYKNNEQDIYNAIFHLQKNKGSN
ncbi:MAG: hypothetical protein HFG91_03945 [Acholeplasmatales bacterium]|jgi:hypothetical protein|nr:hypothetical protein [Acholeplasmatales bacterium]